MKFDQLRSAAGRSGDFDEPVALATGAGTYTADIDTPGALHVAFVRASEAHALIGPIDVRAARALPGVRAVLTGADLVAAGVRPIPPLVIFNGRDGRPMHGRGIPPLATDRVRHVGEALVLVVADSAAIAADAAGLVNCELTPLPAHVDVDAALADSAAPVWPELDSNLALDWEDGDAAVSEAAFAAAHHVETITLDDPPITACAMEPRAAVAAFDAASGRYTLIAPTQGVMVVRKLLAEGALGIDATRLVVLTPDVGGGFGAKVQPYPEYAALLAAAAIVGQPLRWVASRSECFLGDTCGRHSRLTGSMAFDRGGRILGVRADLRVALGAYTSTYVAIVATNNTKNCLSSVYRIGSIRMRSRAVFTNHIPLGPYRGAGRPEAIYLLERLIDRAALHLGMDRAELRRKNLIAPTAMPYAAVNGQTYDSGEFEAVLDRALAAADWQGFAARRRAAAQRGRLAGIGMCCFLEVAGGILEEPASLAFDTDGTVRVMTGAQSIGQGHLATLPRLVAERLGLKVAQVRLVQGSSDHVPGIVATVASRSMMMGASAILLGCDEAIRRGTLIAAHLMEAAPGDIVFEGGRFRIAGTDRSLGLMDLPTLLGASGAPRSADLPDTLDNTAKFTSAGMSFPNGCHICEVEIDPDTGAAQVLRYTAVDDVGRILQPEIVEGQIIGALAQGLGQVFGERLHYDARGQLLSGSLMDYPLPRAGCLPRPTTLTHEVPCRTNPLGVKGAGESGVTGALPATVNALLDALAQRGVDHLDLPFTPGRIWRALCERDAAA
ncbi:MAG: xanthine dehydrogenase family protein molybdopterin-binding subunit [Burkholderiales bacterium]|nr:xanthine dehydrogenase family protein molybdopterin-binding subunit [Burkholderiales bacterium]